MAIENIPTSQTLKQAFELNIYTPDGVPVPFGSLFEPHGATADDHDKTASTSSLSSASLSPSTSNHILVVFIRHFFCGNCQEYIRRLSSPASPFHPTRRRAYLNFSKPNTHPPPSVIIIGPGSPSLLSSYAALTKCAYPIYADPSTQLYDMLGMHKTLSMGGKHPEYIQHNLLSGAVKSAWQIVKRVGNGDALDGGDWHVNGGEFLFVQKDTLGQSVSRKKSHPTSRSRSKSNSPPPQPGSRTRSSSRDLTPSGSASSSGAKPGWEVHWCHRMANSRDHTEIQDLYHNTCSSSAFSLPRPGSRTASPTPLRSILVNGGGGHASPFGLLTQSRRPRSQSGSRARSLSRSYSSECLGACPGPDIPKTREEALLSQALYASASTRPGSKASLRPKSRSLSGISSSDKHQWSKSVTSLTRADSGLAEGVGEDVEPRKSFSQSIASRVGILARSKSFSAKANPRTEGVDEHAANQTGEGESMSASVDTSTITGANGRKRSLSSLVRSVSKKYKTRPGVVTQVRPQTATPTSSTQSLTQTSAQSRPDSAVSLSARHAHDEDETDREEEEEEGGGVSSQPTTAHAPARRTSFSLSRRSNRPSQSPSKMSRGASTIEMGEDGIMLVDGVEFVNVISLKARVDGSRRQNQHEPRHHHHHHHQMQPQNHTVGHTHAELVPPQPHTQTHAYEHNQTQLHVHDRMAGSVRPVGSTMALGTAVLSVHG
ncbi:hypothetical protein PV08_08619 [Exophiala spinifera]|uniref:Uncharacterized protein n=1 Tax=Exophiala spinifera TaxID=91928 RepID=A0A0D1YEC0_9EURO|nr:uncharacterized protein PV08_08619 [Exophiala spinifera]KIW13431.1 hypothetical protein PV08_08619 [Exophiala spinifera]